MPESIGHAYALTWMLARWGVHKTNATTLAEWLTMLTILVLDADEITVTLSELAAITKLPKSTLSRYIAAAVSAGHLSESIDRNDRRRRLIRPTAMARAEVQRHQQRYNQFREALVTNGQSAQPRPLMDVCLELASL